MVTVKKENYQKKKHKTEPMLNPGQSTSLTKALPHGWKTIPSVQKERSLQQTAADNSVCDVKKKKQHNAHLEMAAITRLINVLQMTYKQYRVCECVRE